MTELRMMNLGCKIGGVHSQGNARVETTPEIECFYMPYFPHLSPNPHHSNDLPFSEPHLCHIQQVWTAALGKTLLGALFHH